MMNHNRGSILLPFVISDYSYLSKIVGNYSIPRDIPESQQQCHGTDELNSVEDSVAELSVAVDVRTLLLSFLWLAADSASSPPSSLLELSLSMSDSSIVERLESGSSDSSLSLAPQVTLQYFRIDMS